MITLMIILAWMLPTIAVWRRLAWKMNAPYLITHSCSNICNRCKCSKCGRNRYGHYHTCRDSKWVGMHFTPALLSLAISVLGWPAVLTFYGMTVAKAKLGYETLPFFVPPPAIETKREKAERLAREQESRIRELQAENTRLEKELGIKG